MQVLSSLLSQVLDPIPQEYHFIVSILLDQDVAFGCHDPLKKISLYLKNSGAPPHHLLKLNPMSDHDTVLLDDLAQVLELQALVAEAEKVSVVLNKDRIAHD